MSNKNKNLHKAKKEKNDEFYTLLSDIEKEMVWYKDFFKDKVVYCNCDDARESNFFKYFSENFELLGLKKLITTGYIPGGHGVVLVYEGDKNGDFMVGDDEITTQTLAGDGDFRSPECIEFLKQADVVVTNPPFSLFREYIAQLMTYGKKFLIIGNTNAVAYRDVFPYIRDDKMWIGATNYNTGMMFKIPDDYTNYHHMDGTTKIGRVSTACWWTNIENPRRNEKIDLYKKYNTTDYLKFDYYDAINVNNYKDIPCDYDGVMGVPLTFLGHYNPKQFNIIGLIAGNIKGLAGIDSLTGKDGPYINGKLTYNRILIKRKS